MELEGSFIIDKAAGMTSHDIVARVRRVVGSRRVGHAGTLDPFATGVLVVCIGQSTRLTQFLVGLDKQYIATIRFGYATDTHDSAGKPVTPIASSKTLKAQDIAAVLLEFIGPQFQIPPMYSAKKIGGERLYRAAREGRELERPACPITVYALTPAEPEGVMAYPEGEYADRVNRDGTKDVRIRVHCSSGTYIRRLAHDIGARLGVGAHLVALRREAVGPHRIEESVTLDKLERLQQRDEVRAYLLSPADTVKHMPKVALTQEEVSRIRHGREIQIDRARLQSLEAAEMVGLCSLSGDLQAVGQVIGSFAAIKPRMVLAYGGSSVGSSLAEYGIMQTSQRDQTRNVDNEVGREREVGSGGYKWKRTKASKTRNLT